MVPEEQSPEKHDSARESALRRSDMEHYKSAPRVAETQRGFLVLPDDSTRTTGTVTNAIQ